MKYHKELFSLEEKIVELESFKNLLSVLSNGIDSSGKEELVGAFYTLDGMLQDLAEDLYERFERLFEVIRSDSQKEEFQFFSEDAADELSKIMNSWIVHDKS